MICNLPNDWPVKMPIDCDFNLSRAAAVYYTGEQISGCLSIKVDRKKPVPVEDISIILSGISYVHWKESLGGPPQIEHNDSSRSCLEEPTKVDYTGSKVHINQVKKLTAGQRLLPGITQLWNFDFELPESLPATCRVGHGSVEYTLKVIIERRSKHFKCFTQRLVIRRSLALTDLQPQMKEESCLRLWLPRSVFVPGQSVVYEVASKDGSAAITRLCQCIYYEGQNPERKIKKVIRILSECSEFQAELRLPLTSPIMTDERQPQAIEISYYIETLSHMKPPLRLPICVGTSAPPAISIVESSRLCFVNLALSQSELCEPINQLLAHSYYSHESGALALNKHSERIKLLTCQKKESYVQFLMRYFYRRLLP
ncbi:arrestin domain-containing protein 17 [Drosophila persimilis]|uniref:arrestin domain-containing protein 17 n=1 Tax=Drosophila persimilis TaxID=7234 RepID=UPI000F081972|nr:arrestin domain-containing protein 17 [Drosophila persimilis]